MKLDSWKKLTKNWERTILLIWSKSRNSKPISIDSPYKLMTIHSSIKINSSHPNLRRHKQIMLCFLNKLMNTESLSTNSQSRSMIRLLQIKTQSLSNKLLILSNWLRSRMEILPIYRNKFKNNMFRLLI